MIKASNSSSKKPRLLVAITSFGDKNLELLKTIINAYQAMPLEVSIFVLSNAPKDLGPAVTVVVGLPTNDPWSLPFAHKKILAANLEQYDLFIYSEDDMVITYKNIQAFVKITPSLNDDEIAAFLRYEIEDSGRWTITDAQAGFHWRANSPERRGVHVVADFTNEHSAFYLLNQSQLRKAIASGGFLKDPYVEQYDLACTAATDPYLKCGFRRVICISDLDSFLIHHSSNRYASQVGITLEEFKIQIEALNLILEGVLPAVILCETETKIYNRRWSKNFYEKPSEMVNKNIPTATKTILSFGSGLGGIELDWKKKGFIPTLIPLDSVVGHAIKSQGLETINCTLDGWVEQLRNKRFDCIVISNLIHLVPDQELLLERLCSVLSTKGSLLIISPNLFSIPTWIKRFKNKSRFQSSGEGSKTGIYSITASAALRHLREGGLSAKIDWFDEASKKSTFLRRCLKPFLSDHWLIVARR